MNAAIIIPAFDAAAFLREAIESALRQTRPASAVLVVDDGSTDATPQICASFGDTIRYLRQENAGVSAARNYGAAEVVAEWLVFLDADDRLLPGALAKLLARAAEGEFGVVYGRTIHFATATGKHRTHGNDSAEGAPPAAARANFWKSAIATPGAALIRSALLREIGGFSTKVDSLADRDLWIKAGALASFGFVDEPVVEKRSHGANMCGDVDRALYQAAFIQLNFLDWSEARMLDTSFLETTAGRIIDNVLHKALETRRPRAIQRIIALADERRIVTPLIEKSRRYVSLSPAAADIDLRFRAVCRRVAHLFARG